MKTPRNPDRLIRTYLQEDQAPGQPQVPDHVYNAIRDGIEQTRQRAVIGSMGVPDMNKFLAIGLGAAAVVAVLLIGSNLLGSSSPPPGGQPSASVAPSEAPSVAPTAPAGGQPEGPHVLVDSVDGRPGITVTIAAPLWYGEPSGGVLEWGDGGADPPDGAGTIVFTESDEFYVFGDPCDWSSTRPDTPATTVEALVEALGNQASRDASAPEAITVDGYAGQRITLHVPDDAVFSSCDEGFFGTFGFAGDDPSPYRYHQGPGQIDEMWVLDVNGMIVLMDGAYYAATEPTVVDELHAILQSATFDVP